MPARESDKVMSSDILQQNFSNATGLLLDRTFDPPLVLGEAFIVSKSRAVTCASCVFQYADAPWALQVLFPHPDLTLGIKAISIHPDFDKKEARTNYLTYTGGPPDQYPAQLNDFATIVLDPTLQELIPEKVGELHRALTLPFSSAGVEASGTINGPGEIVQLVNTIIENRREGLLTFYDQLNIPIARLEMGGGMVKKVYFAGVIGEMAFSELLYRAPARGFAFVSQGNFNWTNVRDVTVPPSALMAEAQRRCTEINSGLNYIGGAKVRFSKTTANFDASSANENIRFLLQALWNTVDGFITVDKLSQRVGADTFTIVQGLREMMNRGVISPLNKATPFPCHGTLGDPLVSHTDFDIKPGDSLQAFMLDPLSGGPIWRTGNFNGVSSVLQPKNLLHTVPTLPGAKGALILKDYKLVGVHNGNVVTKPGQTPPQTPDGKVSQMMFMSAMFDMGTKKLRNATDGAEDADSTYAGLRTRTHDMAAAPGAEQYICRKCHASNSQPGPCFNCGTVIIPPPPESDPTGPFAKPIMLARKIKKKYNLTDDQLMMYGGCAAAVPVLLLFFLVSAMMPHPKPVGYYEPAPHHSSPQAITVATDVIGFSPTLPTGFWYEDTSALTKPSQSVGIYSDTSNQKITFIVFDDTQAMTGLDSFITKPPFSEAKSQAPASQGVNASLPIGKGLFKYYEGKYIDLQDKEFSMLIGAFLPKAEGKSVYVTATQLHDTGLPYDFKSALFIIDSAASLWTRAENAKKEAGDKGDKGDEDDDKANYATEDEIKEYLEKVADKIQEQFELPDGFSDELDKPKSTKLKVNVNVDIGDDGSVKKLEVSTPSDSEKVTNAVTAAITAAAPFKDVPKTKRGVLSMTIKLRKDKIKATPPS